MSGLRNGEMEDPGNSQIEDPRLKVYWGPGYRRQGSHYVFSGPVSPVAPSEPTTVEGMIGRSMSRLEIEMHKQENKLVELYQPLETYRQKFVEDATYGRPVIRTGLLRSIFSDIDEQKFICDALREALAEEKEKG